MLSFDEPIKSASSSGDVPSHAIAKHYFNRVQGFDFDKQAYENESKPLSASSADAIKLTNIEDDFSFALKKAKLADFIPQSIPFLSPTDNAYWQSLLSEVFEGQLYLYHYHQISKRKQLLADDLATLNTLKSYIKLLSAESPAAPPSSYSTTSSNSLSLANDIRDVQRELCHCPSVAMRKWLSKLNWYRLYWIWVGGGGGLLSGILDACGQNKASKRLDSPAAGLSAISYSLYFTRLAFNLMMMFKHFVPGPWMSEHEKALIPPVARLNKEWQKRKFVIINDVVWGGINLATANWLVSGASNHAKLLGAWGGLLNVILMSVDIAVSIWQLFEEEKQFKQQQQLFEEKLEAVKSQLQQPRLATGKKNELLRQQTIIKEQLATLEENWHYRRQILAMTRNLAIAFVPVMVLICASLFPPLLPFFAVSQAALNAMVIGGGVAATGITMFQSFYEYQVEINQMNAKLDKLAHKEAYIIPERDGLLTEVSRSEEQSNRLSLLTLELEKLNKDSEYLNKMIRFKRASQVYSMVSQVVFPAIVMGALFTPPPIAIAIIVAAALLLVITKRVLNHYKPEAVDNENIKLDDDTAKQKIEPRLTERLQPKKTKCLFFKWKKEKSVEFDGKSLILTAASPVTS